MEMDDLSDYSTFMYTDMYLAHILLVIYFSSKCINNIFVIQAYCRFH